MLDFDSEDIDGMDADERDDEEPAPIGPWKATSSYDVYMVDTPKDDDERAEGRTEGLFPREAVKAVMQAPPQIPPRQK